MKKGYIAATALVLCLALVNSNIFAAEPPQTPNSPVTATQSIQYGDYTYSYCETCRFTPKPATLAAATTLGLKIKSDAKGEEGNITGPGGVVARGPQESNTWLQKQLEIQAQQQKLPEQFCALVTPGQSSEYGPMWGQPGVQKYGDPKLELAGVAYDANGNRATIEESYLNFRLRTGGKRGGGDEDMGSYGQMNVQPVVVDTEEIQNGLGYLDKKAIDEASNYATLYHSKKRSSPLDRLRSNEDIANDIIVASVTDPKNAPPLPKIQTVKPNETQAKEHIYSYVGDSKKAGYKNKGDKVMAPGRYPRPGSASSAGRDRLGPPDTFVSEQCEFRTPTDADKKTSGFPSTTPPTGPGGWPGGGQGSGGGGGGGSMEDMMKLLEAIQGMAGGGGGGGQPNSSSSTQPFYCPAEIAEVCGTDGNTYGNACIAEQENKVKIAYEGPCDPNRNQDSIVDNAAQLMRSAIVSGIPKNMLEAITLSITKMIAQMLQGQFLPITNIGQ